MPRETSWEPRIENIILHGLKVVGGNIMIKWGCGVSTKNGAKKKFVGKCTREGWGNGTNESQTGHWT